MVAITFQSYINNPYRPCATEVRALYGCAWRPWLHTTQLGSTGAARPMWAFSTGLHVDWGLSQWLIHIDCGLSYTTGQAKARLWLVLLIPSAPCTNDRLP